MDATRHMISHLFYLFILLCIGNDTVADDSLSIGLQDTIRAGQDESGSLSVVSKYGNTFGKWSPFSGRYRQLFLQQGEFALKTCSQISNESDQTKKQVLKDGLTFLSRDAGFADVDTFCKIFPYAAKITDFGMLKIDAAAGPSRVNGNVIAALTFGTDFTYGVLALPARPCNPTLQSRLSGNTSLRLDPSVDFDFSLADVHVLAGGQLGFVCSNSDGSRFIMVKLGGGPAVKADVLGDKPLRDLVASEFFVNASAAINSYVGLNSEITRHFSTDTETDFTSLNSNVEFRVSNNAPLFVIPGGEVTFPNDPRHNVEGSVTIDVVWVK